MRIAGRVWRRISELGARGARRPVADAASRRALVLAPAGPHGAIVREARERPTPGARIPAAERHALAIRQSLRWAKRAAGEGDYERALGWLSMVERVEGRLPDEWRAAREAWRASWTAQHARGPRRRPGGR